MKAENGKQKAEMSAGTLLELVAQFERHAEMAAQQMRLLFDLHHEIRRRLQCPDADVPSLLAAAATAFSVPTEDIDRRRCGQAVAARWCVMETLRERGYSAKAIGRMMNLDHSGVLYALRELRQRLAMDASFRQRRECYHQLLCQPSETA